MKVIVMLAALLSLTTMSATGDEHLKMTVSPLMSFAPSNLTVRMRVTASQENRTLDIVADSDGFYRSSQIPLEGERAPEVFTVQFRDMPIGEYDVYGVLTDRTGERRAIARQHVRVVGSGGE